VQELVGSAFDVVITVCDNAAENCPVFPGNVERIHWSFPDPAEAVGDEEKMLAFRTVRDGLLERFKAFLAERNVHPAAIA
jgi:arsenate reductase